MNRILDHFHRELMIHISFWLVTIFLPNILMGAVETGTEIQIIESTKDHLELRLSIKELNILESARSDEVMFYLEGETHGAVPGSPEKQPVICR